MSNILPKPALVTIYKIFIIPYLNYSNIVCAKTHNNSFHNKFETTHYNTYFSLTVTFRGTSADKISQQLGFRSLQYRRWFERICLFCNILNTESPVYHFKNVSERSFHYNTRNADQITLLHSNCFLQKRLLSFSH